MINAVDNQARIQQTMQMNVDLLKQQLSSQNELSQKVVEMNTQMRVSNQKSSLQAGAVDLFA